MISGSVLNDNPYVILATNKDTGVWSIFGGFLGSPMNPVEGLIELQHVADAIEVEYPHLDTTLVQLLSIPNEVNQHVKRG